MSGQAILTVLSLVSTHLIFRKLGADILGVIFFATTVTSVLIILSDMGLSPTVTREIAAHRRNDDRYVYDLIGSSSALAWSAYALSCLLIGLLAPFLIEHWLQIGDADHDQVMIAFIAISASLLLAVPRALYGAIIAGNDRMDFWNVANVATVGLQQLGMIAVLSMGGTLYHVTVWYLVSGVMGLAIFALMASRLSNVSLWHIAYKWSVIRKNVHFGSRLFANTMVGYLVGQVDRWIVSKTLSAAMLGYYGVAQGLVSKGAMVPGAIASAAFPALSTDVTNKQRSGWIAQYHKLQDFCCFVYVPVSAAVVMIGIVVLTLVFNDVVVRDSWAALLFLALGQLVLGVQYVPYMLSLAMKRPDISLRANLCTVVISIPVAILLTIQFGLVGAALSTVVSNGLHMIFFIPRFSDQCLETNGWKWFRVSGYLVGLGVLSYAVPWGVLWAMGLGLSVVGLIVGYVVGSGIFLLVGWLAVGSELKGVVRQQLRRVGINVPVKAL